MNTPGYEQLAAVLQAAFDQAAKGKGAERHADNKPFHEQPMQTSSDLLGTDAGLAFQAIKKVREGSTFAEFDRFEREMLGAINYIAGMVIWRRRHLSVAAQTGTTEREVGKGKAAALGASYELAAQCTECKTVSRGGKMHVATCSKLTAPKEFVEQVEAAFDELEGVDPVAESAVSGRCPACGVALLTRHADDCPVGGTPATDHALEPTSKVDNTAALDEFRRRTVEATLRTRTTAEPAASIDDDSPLQQAVAQNGNTGEHYDDPFYGAPEWAKWKAQDADGEWRLFGRRPVAQIKFGYWVVSKGRVGVDRSGEPNTNWRDTLIQRP